MTSCSASRIDVTNPRPDGSALAATALSPGTGTSRQTVIKPPNASAFAALSTCCERSPILMPRQSRNPKSRTRPTPAGTFHPANAGTSGWRYSVKTIPPSAIGPQVDIQSLHPTTNAGYSPSPRRTMGYWPPERPSMAPGSASDIAPIRAYNPPTIQMPMKSAGCGSWAATSPGVRRMPIRMVLPISTAIPNDTPRTRCSLPRPVAAAGPAPSTVRSIRSEVSLIGSEHSRQPEPRATRECQRHQARYRDAPEFAPPESQSQDQLQDRVRENADRDRRRRQGDHPSSALHPAHGIGQRIHVSEAEDRRRREQALAAPHFLHERNEDHHSLKRQRHPDGIPQSQRITGLLGGLFLPSAGSRTAPAIQDQENDGAYNQDWRHIRNQLEPDRGAQRRGHDPDPHRQNGAGANHAERQRPPQGGVGPASVGEVPGDRGGRD